MRRVRQLKEDGSVLPLDVMFGAFSAGRFLVYQVPAGTMTHNHTEDVITEYAFQRPGRKVEAPNFDDDFHAACINGGKQLFLTRQFPWLLKMVRTIPPHMMLKFNPSMSSFFAMHKVKTNAVRQLSTLTDLIHWAGHCDAGQVRPRGAQSHQQSTNSIPQDSRQQDSPAREVI